MFNLHLLNKYLTPGEIADIEKSRYSIKNGAEYVRRLPAFTVAICPFCSQENIEYLHLYSSRNWLLGNEPGKSVEVHEGIVFHCEHFVLVQTFLKYADARLGKTVFKPSYPYVIGYVLEQKMAQAVVHTLPVCDYVNDQYLPLHTLFMVTYFSERAKFTYDSIGSQAIHRKPSPEAATWLVYPKKDESHWWDLLYWVERGLLHWVDASEAKVAGDSLSRLRTQDVDKFPYKQL